MTLNYRGLVPRKIATIFNILLLTKRADAAKRTDSTYALLFFLVRSKNVTKILNVHVEKSSTVTNMMPSPNVFQTFFCPVRFQWAIVPQCHCHSKCLLLSLSHKTHRSQPLAETGRRACLVENANEVSKEPLGRFSPNCKENDFFDMLIDGEVYGADTFA